MLSAIRRVHGVQMHKVRSAIAYVEERLQIERPLAHEVFKTNGVDLFVERAAVIISASQNGQTIMKGVMEGALKRVQWDPRGLAQTLFPVVRVDSWDAPPTIKIDPRFGFGRPVLAESGLRTDVIVARYSAGESHVELAEDYGLGIEAIEDAIRAELGEAA